MRTKLFRLAARALAIVVLLQLSHASSLAIQEKRERVGASARRAVVISIDGLDVRYIRRADAYGLKIPNLRRLMNAGAFAGVEGVYPSVTYPSHATIVTGALPARHAIVNNSVFEPPTERQTGRWFWFANHLKADALWDAAARANLSTGMVSWPVSAGAGDWNVPEIWKEGTSPGDSLTVTLAEISAHARPEGLVKEIALKDPDVYKNVTKDEGDDMRTRWAEYILREKNPRLMLVHLFDLDHFEHDFGPFTPEAFAMLEKVDGYVGRILSAAESAGGLSDTSVFIVSDHGFRAIKKIINPAVVLVQAGLAKTKTQTDANGKTRTVVSEWRAFTHSSGGSCAIILRDPSDEEAARDARKALEDFNEKAGGKLFRVVDAKEARRLGAFPQAAFVLEAFEGYSFGGRFTGEAVVESVGKGTHGYLPTPADYRAAFIAAGPEIRKRGDLGTIRMTQIGPTVARSLGLTLRDAQGRAIELK